MLIKKILLFLCLLSLVVFVSACGCDRRESTECITESTVAQVATSAVSTQNATQQNSTKGSLNTDSSSNIADSTDKTEETQASVLGFFDSD